jgi:GMP reductase
LLAALPFFLLMQQGLAYSDIFLRPSYSTLSSRKLADVTAELGEQTFKLPVMPANMVACINFEKAKWLSENHYFYVMHRFIPGGSLALLDFCRRAEREEWETISISVGVKQDDYALISYLPATRCDYITIDIAHGHSLHVKNMLKHIRTTYKQSKKKCPFIIAGNVATGQGVKDLTSWGADAIKVGIGGGGACSTKNKTGFHVPMWSCVKECVDAAIELKDYNFAETEKVWEALEEHSTQDEIEAMIPDSLGKLRRPVIIADGGVRENADITKALVAGADWVMAGSLYAACIDSPAESITQNDVLTGKVKVVAKKYFGSASARNKGFSKHVEGFEVDLPCNGMTYEEKLTEMEEDLQSSVSYAGGDDLSVLRKVEALTTKAGTIVNNDNTQYVFGQRMLDISARP